MVISLAKKEELIYVQGREEPLRLPRNNPGLKLLQYLRDEAHRFAQHYHHLLRSKAQFAEEVREGRRPPARRKGEEGSGGGGEGADDEAAGGDAALVARGVADFEAEGGGGGRV
jgi:hypothetical protein